MSAKHGYFLSDLHLLAKRSHSEQAWTQIARVAEHAHTMVLGGDIFDFKWSTLQSLEDSIEQARQWLEKLVTSYPACYFYYVLGNHDAHPDFVAALDRLAFDQPRLHWQPYLLRIEHCVFLHGDVVDSPPNHAMLGSKRRKGDRHPPPPAVAHLLYDLVVKTQLHRLAVQVAKREAMVLKKLSLYLADHALDAKHGVTDVYFGHTHREVNGIRYQGQTFYNGGASIHGLRFRVIQTSLGLP
jgi:UDP-2,3-diacylglucosamine pyrophosphatase LpxH